jgi:predicted small integral membrane protein
MIPRLSKIILLAAVTFFFLLVFLNNGVLDFRGNYEFVRHVLSVDTTGEHGQLWRVRGASTDVFNAAKDTAICGLTSFCFCAPVCRPEHF